MIWGHAHPLTQTAGLSVFGNSVGSLAVKVFFVVSGFLVARSWWADPAPLRYLAKRSLRIFPALVVVTLLSALVMGVALTTLPLTDYLNDPLTWGFVWRNIALSPAYQLPAVFGSNPYPNVVNGSLWSLPAEFLMYLLIPAAYALGRAWNPDWLIVLLALAVSMASVYLLRIDIRPLPVYYGTSVTSVLDAAPYFLIGAVYARTRLGSMLDPGVALFLAATLAFLQPSVAWLQEASLLVAVPYCTLALATRNAPLLSGVSRWGDPSYGVYLYGWPLQQLVCHFVPNVSAIGNTLAALPLAVVMGYASWHLLEKRALALKPRVRGLRVEPFRSEAAAG